MQNSAYVNYPTLTSQEESDVPRTTLDLQEQGYDSSLILFRKCNTDSQLDPDESTEEGPSTLDQNFIRVDKEISLYFYQVAP